LVDICCTVARDADWNLPWHDFAARLDAAYPDLPAPARMLLEMAAVDGTARTRGESVAVTLGGTDRHWMPSNQTLFQSDDTTLLRRADAYAARGFLDLKLRIGFDGFDDDLRRIGLLRDRLGTKLILSVDANGTWDEATAADRLAKLAPLGVRYVEQPLPAEAWEATAALARISPIPLMLDESLSSAASVERLIASHTAPLAHLKLAKFGGLDRLMRAGRLLADAGFGVMVGQMNEGCVSTLAAAHAAAALGAPFCELYGADGLAADPAGRLRYADGGVFLPSGPGLGLDRHAIEGQILLEISA
jgi:L-alanine-DL-glutamate epimerase-like enolase superfamily enzyme